MPILLSGAAISRFNARFPAVFNGGRIDIYTGDQPESSDFAPTGTKVAEITAPGGLQFVMLGQVAGKDPAQAWSLQGIATGEAGWFRLVANPADPGYVGGDYPRVDGLVWPDNDARVGLVISSTAITPETERAVTSFLFTF